MSKVEEFIAEARTFLGTPWTHQGRSKAGVDCVGFLLIACKNIDVSVFDIRGYSRAPDGWSLKDLMDKQKSIYQLESTNNIIPGDIGLFKIKKQPQHVALFVDSKTAEIGMIHSYNGGYNRVIEHDFADFWKKRLIAVYRLK